MEIYNSDNLNRRTLSTASLLQMSSDGHDYHLSLPQASKILGVTRQRVQKLCEVGLLDADYDQLLHYRRWHISETSVRNRLARMQAMKEVA